MSGRGLTQKQEAFCRAVITEPNTSAAYRKCYSYAKMKDTTINRRAKELMDNSKIAARLDELRAEHAKRNEFTVDRIARGLEQARLQAIEDRQNSAAVQAGMGLAKLFGLLEDKLTIKGQVTAETGIEFLSQKYGVNIAQQIEDSDHVKH